MFVAMRRVTARDLQATSPPGFFLSAFLIVSLASPALLAATKTDPRKDIASTMRLLHANCLSCHNSEKHKSGLALDTRDAALKGGEDGPVIVAGQPDKSVLLKALASDADPHMPPKKQLSNEQIQLVRRWIQSGATWDQRALDSATAPRQVVLGTLPENYHPTFALALAPDDKQLAIGRGNRIALHSTASTNFALLKDFKAHRDVVRSLAWSRDGRFLASGSFREITLWDAATLSRLWSTQSLGRVTALHFTATGDALIAADSSEAQSGWVRL